MNKSFSSLWAALGMLALLVGMFSAVSSSQADQTSDAVARAVGYLKTKRNDATKTMALVAACSDGTVGVCESVDVSYLQNFSGSAAIEYAKPIMAIAAAGENPSTYPNEDFVAKLKSFSDGTQMGSAEQVNDDIWGVLALRAAGVATSDSVIQSSKAFVLDNQNADGGWAWNTGDTSDTNDTAAAIMALLEAGVSKSDTAIQNAFAYLKNAQNDDGGFPYDPKSEFGTDSDANSDAWVIMAFQKLGEDTSSIVPHLLSLQDDDGGFWWMASPAEFNNKGATADAVIALSGKSFPVKKFVPSPENNSVSFRIVGSVEEICKGTVSASNAMEVVVNAAEQCGYTYEIQDTSFGPYLVALSDDKAEGQSGWMYAVNNVIPNIGAVDYSLSGGEHVVWFFGEFGDEPPASGIVSDSLDLAVEIVETGGGNTTPPEIAFSVNPSSLDFGKLVPGSSASGEVVLKNEGQKNLSIEVEIHGDSVFNFLKLDDILWSTFSALLSSGTQEEVRVQLAVPPEFNAFGTKQGSLIFWASAHE